MDLRFYVFRDIRTALRPRYPAYLSVHSMPYVVRYIGGVRDRRSTYVVHAGSWEAYGGDYGLRHWQCTAPMSATFN
jgi:hypothetical protein